MDRKDSKKVLGKKVSKKECCRLERMQHCENLLYRKGYRAICGVDEAGRGPLAGPVVAAGCILPPGFFLENLNDSKQVPAEMRKKLYETLIRYPGIIYGIGIVDAETIDRVNILQATFRAMKEAIEKLNNPVDYLLFDGNQYPFFSIPSLGIVKGDSLSLSVAAASILAKETRDRIMVEYHEEWSEYGFDENKGYGTREHLEALERVGPCPIHRRSFDPVKTKIMEMPLFDRIETRLTK
jgi:ribonuclease HII